MTPLARVDEALGRRVSMRPLALLRIPIGFIALVHLWPFLDDARHGVQYRDSFYEPYASWYPELSRGAYGVLLGVGAVAALCMTLGLLTRLACAVTFGVVAYNLFLVRCGKLHVVTIHQPQLGNDFSNQLAVVEDSHH